MSAEKEHRFLNPWRLRLLGVFLLSIVAFAPSLWGNLIWDDRVWFFGQAKNLSEIIWGPTFGKFWRPLPAFSFWLEHKIFGVVPAMAHTINLLLHATTALLVVGIALLLTKRRDAALWSGALFAVQPAQIVPTGWIGGRNDLLCAISAALFVYSLLRWHRDRRARWIVVGCVSFFLCMLAKENTVALLLAVPLIALWEGRKKDMWITLPAFGVTAAVFIGLWLTHAPKDNWGPYNIGRQSEFTLAGAVHYAALLTIPNPWSLNLYEPTPLSGAGWLALGALILVGCGIFLWKAPRLYALLLALALIAWLPNSNIVPIPSMPLAPYRSAVSGLFIAILLGSVMRPALGASLIAACTVMCLSHSSTTVSGSIPFFRAIIRYDPGFDVAWDNLTYNYITKKRPIEAVAAGRDCLILFAGSADLTKEPDWNLASRRLDPCIGWRNVRSVVAAMYSRYGDALAAHNEDGTAIVAYERALKIEENKNVRVAMNRLKPKAAPSTKTPPSRPN